MNKVFGHEEVAFTGAFRGCFEMSHTGTLFLDEIGEIPTHLQVKLLGVLDNKKIQRLGGEKSLRVVFAFWWQRTGINQRALYVKMKRYGLNKEKYR